MLTENERHLGDPKMLRTLAATTNRACTQQRLYQKLLHSIRCQNVITRTASTKNPQNLPALPVPKLNDTIDKYLKSVKPFLDECEFNTTTRIFNKFSGSCGDGPRLQEYLLEKAKCTSNWLEEWWLNTAYLGFREPVVVYSSPGQSFPLQKFNCEEERLAYAAKMILGAASYKMLIDAKKIPVEKMGKDELDMNQYNNIFGTCRIPDCPLDRMDYNPASKHIIVAHNYHFFKVTLFNDKCQPLSEKQILKQLQNILAESAQPAEQIGILTSDQRDNWANAYNALVHDPVNKQSVCEIQKSLFLVCLDSAICHNSNDNRKTAAGKQLVHGGGSAGSAGNRWYDKTIQFVVGMDGVVGLTYEHSPAEGQPVAVMVDYVYQFIKNDSGKSIPDGDHDGCPKKLCFTVRSDVATAICTAKRNIDKLMNNFELNAFTYKTFGKNFVKSQKLSPDSFIQIAFQYTFYRMYNKPAAHYESAATRKYIGGRTETIRSCSPESVTFAKTMLNPEKSDSDKVAALRAAINSHKQYSVEAVNGLGVDRHLLGLKLAAKALGLPLPEIYKDPSYERSTRMRISSSQVATKCDGFMCYGPTEHDGYGCCYNPRNDDMNFAISAFADNCDTSAAKFRDTLECCLNDMQTMLAKTQKAKM